MIDTTRLNQIYEQCYINTGFILGTLAKVNEQKKVKEAVERMNSIAASIDELLSALRSLPKIHKATDVPPTAYCVMLVKDLTGANRVLAGRQQDYENVQAAMLESELIAYFTQQQKVTA